VLQALEQDNIDDMIDSLYPEDEGDTLPNGEEMPKTTAEALNVIKNLRNEIVKIVEKEEILIY
jgi:hypothetical protein